ncbi:MAG: sigma-70 family RNA polymerase sigma factor [Eubacteriales bacterium]
MLIDDIIKEILNGKPGYKMQLISKASPLIVSNIKKYGLYKNYDDVYQDSVEILLNCIHKFKPSMNVPFIAYYQLNLNYYHLNRSYKEKELLNLDATVTEDKISRKNNLPSEDVQQLEQMIHREEIEKLYESINKLSPKQKWIITEHYFKGKTLVQISQECNKNYQSIVKLKSRALIKLLDYLK